MNRTIFTLFFGNLKVYSGIDQNIKTLGEISKEIGRKVTFVLGNESYLPPKRDLKIGKGIGKKEESCLLYLPMGVNTLTPQTVFSYYTVKATQIQIVENKTVQINLLKDEF